MPTTLPTRGSARSEGRGAAMLVLALAAMLLLARATVPALRFELRAGSCVLADIPCELLGP